MLWSAAQVCSTEKGGEIAPSIKWLKRGGIAPPDRTGSNWMLEDTHEGEIPCVLVVFSRCPIWPQLKTRTEGHLV